MNPFDGAVAALLLTEGGYVNDPLDPGGETNFGITVAVARAAGYAGEMKLMTVPTAKAIYKFKYWDTLELDHVALINPGLAVELFDSGVNCGIATAGKWLQQAINALRPAVDISVDGAIGGGTLHALRALRPFDVALVTKLCNIQQGAHYLSIVQRNPTQERYLRGWLKRC